MGYELHYRGSNTLNLKSYYDKIVNDYIYHGMFTLNSIFGWADGFKILDDAPVKVKDNNTADFCFDTAIYSYDDLICQTGKNKTLDFLIEQIKLAPKTKYIFLQIF